VLGLQNPSALVHAASQTRQKAGPNIVIEAWDNPQLRAP